jgi:hypothetical protein
MPLPLPCRFGVVYPDATGGLPIKSKYVQLLLRRGRHQPKPVGSLFLFSAFWVPPSERYRSVMFHLHQERDGFIRFAGERDYRPGEDV